MYQFKAEQFISAEIEQCWDFFSDPANLKLITPDYMGFDILTEVPDEMYEGMMISYRVRPLMGLPVNWVTEITKIDPMNMFIDEQRKGPYRFWHHEHYFRKVEGGVLMNDLLSYDLPLGVIGKIAHRMVRKRIEEIFDYRCKKIRDIFPEKSIPA